MVQDSLATIASVQTILSIKDPLYTDIINPQATAYAILSSLLHLRTLGFEPSKWSMTSKAKWLAGRICLCYGCLEPAEALDKDRDFVQVLTWASSSTALEYPADTRSLILRFQLYNTRFADMLTLLQTWPTNVVEQVIHLVSLQMERIERSQLEEITIQDGYHAIRVQVNILDHRYEFLTQVIKHLISVRRSKSLYSEPAIQDLLYSFKEVAPTIPVPDEDLITLLSRASSAQQPRPQSEVFETALSSSRPYRKVLNRASKNLSQVTMISWTTFGGGSRARSRSVLVEQMSI